jgi:dTDP-4-amino-4,6-dideoxygalactose transaminase
MDKIKAIIAKRKKLILIVLAVGIAVIGMTKTDFDDKHLLPLLEDAKAYVETVDAVSPTVVVE